MHNNYYFLRQLTDTIRPAWEGSRLQALYTQEKNELIIWAVKNEKQDVYLKAHFSPAFCCLSFPESHHRARRNSMNLFGTAEGTVIKSVRMYENERAFSFILDNGSTLVFKLFGNRSNIILFNEDQVTEVFRSELKNDYSMTPHLDRPIIRDRTTFLQADGNLKKLFPTFGPQVREYLGEQNYEERKPEEKWKLVLETLELLNASRFYVMDKEEVYLSLLPQPVTPFNDPVKALNHFYQQYFMRGLLGKEKKEVLGRLRKQAEKSERYISKLYNKLESLQHQESYRQKADLLMAHLHEIPKGSKEVSLPDFYDPSKKINITMNPRLSAQDNAAHLYKKAKNQHLEITQMETNIHRSEELLQNARTHIERIEPMEEVRELRNYVEAQQLGVSAQSSTRASLPYRDYEIDGFNVRVGRNARGNDEMLQQFSFKDDLWLHAKDVAGSHVLIKYQSGKTFPRPVVEKAASLAAFYSKRKNDTLCPVIVTHRKYVRKRKGDPAGMVVVDREEEVILVPPADIG